MNVLVAIVALITGIVVGRTMSSVTDANPKPVDDLTAVTMLTRYGV